MEKKVYLDWIRFVGVFLVLYGHLATAASFITQEATVFSDKYVLPINDATLHKAYIIDSFLAKFNTASAVIGVILFLWLTGYLTAMTRQKYTKGGFVTRRIIRLYPALIIAVVACGIIASFMGVKYSVFQYIANGLCLYPFMGFGATIGTLWTLTVELFFYFIVLHLVQLNFKNILIIDGIILFLTASQAITQCGDVTLMYILKFIPIVLFGSMMFEFHKIKGVKKYFELIIVAVLSYLIPYISITYTFTAEVNYKSIASYLFAFGIWMLIYLLHKIDFKLINVSNKLLSFIVGTSYFVYLLQLHVGFTTMYFLREAGVGPYLNIICGIAVTFLVSAVLHYGCERPLQKGLLSKLKISESKLIAGERENIVPPIRK